MLVLVHTLQRHICAMDNVADPGCLSRIPDPETATKEVRQKIVVKPFFVATNFTKLKIILFLKC
jgi:hypothetical protein